MNERTAAAEFIGTDSSSFCFVDRTMLAASKAGQQGGATSVRRAEKVASASQRTGNDNQHSSRGQLQEEHRR